MNEPLRSKYQMKSFSAPNWNVLEIPWGSQVKKPVAWETSEKFCINSKIVPVLESRIQKSCKLLASNLIKKDPSTGIFLWVAFSVLDFFETLLNPYYTRGFFLYATKTLKDLWFSDVFWGYGKRPVVWYTFKKCQKNTEHESFC